MSNHLPVIFTHYGNTSYLCYTLNCLKRTNPRSRLILLGDSCNKKIALRYGWEFFDLSSYSDDLLKRFNSSFAHVKGRDFQHIRNGKDWLKFVFERWFIVNVFIKQEKIERFWHFDSDTIVADDLSIYVPKLIGYDFTLQCNNTCLNGLIDSAVVNEFCEHICELFEDEIFVAEQQREFDSSYPSYAFSEMRAFDHYQKFSNKRRVHLLNAFDNVVFDDCICQEHGFNMTQLPSGEIIKDIFFKKGKIYGARDQEIVELATLNLSWVPDYLFDWALNGILNKETKSVKQINYALKHRILDLSKRVSRKLNNV